jgi:uncharacterized membrane protein
MARVPAITLDRMRKLHLILHLEMVGVAIIILCAALMARGIGVMV